MLGSELGEVAEQGVPMASQRVGVTTALVGGRDLHRRLGHQCAQTRVVGLLVEEPQLLFGQPELRGNLFDAFAEFGELAFDG